MQTGAAGGRYSPSLVELGLVEQLAVVEGDFIVANKRYLDAEQTIKKLREMLASEEDASAYLRGEVERLRGDLAAGQETIETMRRSVGYLMKEMEELKKKAPVDGAMFQQQQVKRMDCLQKQLVYVTGVAEDTLGCVRGILAEQKNVTLVVGGKGDGSQDNLEVSCAQREEVGASGGARGSFVPTCDFDTPSEKEDDPYAFTAIIPARAGASTSATKKEEEELSEGVPATPSPPQKKRYKYDSKEMAAYIAENDTTDEEMWVSHHDRCRKIVTSQRQWKLRKGAQKKEHGDGGAGGA